METKAPAYLALVMRKFDDKDVDNLIEHFRDKERRNEFFKEYKEIEMLYEIISPDAFLRPLMEDYATLSSIYAVVRNAYAKKVYVDKVEKSEQRKKEQTAKGLDAMTYFVLCKLTDDGIPNPEIASRKVVAAFAKHPNWRCSEAELREVRKQVTFALIAEVEDIEKVTATVEALFTLLPKSFRR